MADETNYDNQDLAAIEAMLRDLDAGDLQLIDPPADVWDGIVTALRDDAAVTPTASDASTTGTVVSLEARRRRVFGSPRSLMLVAAATVLLVVGVAALTLRGGDDTTVLATADLQFATGFDPLGTSAAAHAELVEAGDVYEISIDDATLPDPSAEDADLELWLIHVGDDGNIVDLVSLGIVDRAGDTFGFLPASTPPSTTTSTSASSRTTATTTTRAARSCADGSAPDRRPAVLRSLPAHGPRYASTRWMTYGLGHDGHRY